MGVLASIKQLRECASDTVTSVLQRGATAEDTEWGLPWEGSTGSCLVTPDAWAQQLGKVGLPPECGVQQDHSPLRGLLAPTVRWGGSGWTGASGLGEGSRLEMSLKSSQGGRRKARRGQVGYSTDVQVMVVLLEATQSQKEWLSGAQLHSLVFFFCLSVTSQSYVRSLAPTICCLSVHFSSSDCMYSGLRNASYHTLERTP